MIVCGWNVPPPPVTRPRNLDGQTTSTNRISFNIMVYHTHDMLRAALSLVSLTTSSSRGGVLLPRGIHQHNT